MLMEVSTPGRTLKPPSSIKAGSSCPCTITLAPVTVDSRGMKSFCSVRSVRDRPEDTVEEELGMETHPLTLVDEPFITGGIRPVSPSGRLGNPELDPGPGLKHRIPSLPRMGYEAGVGVAALSFGRKDRQTLPE